MPNFRTGTVLEIVEEHEHVQRLRVDVAGQERIAILFSRWAPPATAGDRVVLNTTAVDLDLGTGGADFVVWNSSVESYDAPSGGHIMKLRYTPAQCDVLAVEAQESPHHELMARSTSLEQTPVVATSLHSQLLPVVCGIRMRAQDARIAYVMTDGAALEAHFSNTLRRLVELGWLSGVVTTGHALGGDIEAVTLHSGLLAARHVLKADAIVAGVGPGVVGTATPYGTTSIELGTIALASSALNGRGVVCVRLSEGDARARHQGLSHHVTSGLGWVAEDCVPSRATVVVPSGWAARVAESLAPWPVVEQDGSIVVEELRNADASGLAASHMCRGIDDDRVFFESAGAAGLYAGDLVSGA
jgi:hypothetical protein